MHVDYATAYEISQRAPDWPFACVGFIALIAGVVIICGKRRFKWAQPHWLFAVFCLVFGFLWVSVVGFSTINADSSAYSAYRNGEYQTVEGIVTDFHPMPYEGHQDECFSVADQRFCYSDYEIAPGFHNATSHGGPIRAGLPVRISYRDSRILKLEVPKGDVPTPSRSAAIESQGQQQWQQRAENDHSCAVHRSMLDIMVEPQVEASHVVLGQAALSSVGWARFSNLFCIELRWSSHRSDTTTSFASFIPQPLSDNRRDRRHHVRGCSPDDWLHALDGP